MEIASVIETMLTVLKRNKQIMNFVYSNRSCPVHIPVLKKTPTMPCPIHLAQLKSQKKDSWTLSLLASLKEFSNNFLQHIFKFYYFWS